ncbi:hypothetical protein F6P94_10795 [Escherichia coli]|nr:hypothetical protein F6P94_10795 [Escherichia coli]
MIFRQPVNERCDLGHELLFFITKITCNALTDNRYFKMSTISGLIQRCSRVSRSNSVDSSQLYPQKR